MKQTRDKIKRKDFALMGVTILLCSMILGALPGIAANSDNVSPVAQQEQGQEMQKASATLYGDANGDGKIDMRDVTYVGLIILGKKPTNELADANQDGRINVLDITYIELMILGKAPSGTLRIGISKVYGRVGFFSPGTGQRYYARVTLPVNSPLVVQDINGEILPCLAKEWETEDECKTLIFHLNEKAKWHDGKPVTSEDVKFTSEYRREMDPRVEEFMQEYLDEIETPDKHTVIFHMKKPFSPFLTWLHPLGLTVILPKHIWEDISPDEAREFEDMTGCGPFIFDKLDKDRNVIVLKANNAYFLGRPKVARVEIQMFRTGDSMLLALKRGDIDVVGRVKGPSVPSLLGEEDINIVLTPSYSTKNIWFNMRNYPVNITEVRQAMAYCIDYDQLAQTSILNYGEAGGYCPDISSSMWWFNPDAIRYTRDVSKANELLDSIGFLDTDDDGIRELPDGSDLVIDLYAPAPDTTYMREAELIRGWMDDVGIEIDIKAVGFPTWVNQFLFDHTFDTIIVTTLLLDHI
jgi:peptide/nickel transport system substrate-binding protein